MYSKTLSVNNTVKSTSVSKSKYCKLNVIINNVCTVKTNVRTVKSTNECIVIIKKYLHCEYVIMYSKKSNVSTVVLHLLGPLDIGTFQITGPGFGRTLVLAGTLIK